MTPIAPAEPKYAAPASINDVPVRFAVETDEIDGQGNHVIETLVKDARAICVEPNTAADEAGGLFIYGVHPTTRRPATLYALEPYAARTNDGTHWIFTSALDGRRYHLYRQSGCGCGNLVKKMSIPPFRYLNVTDPESVQR